MGPKLLAGGLEILELSSEELAAAQDLFTAKPSLSLPDCSAYIGARRTDHHLLTGDSVLRRHAEANGVP